VSVGYIVVLVAVTNLIHGVPLVMLHLWGGARDRSRGKSLGSIFKWGVGGRIIKLIYLFYSCVFFGF